MITCALYRVKTPEALTQKLTEMNNEANFTDSF